MLLMHSGSTYYFLRTALLAALGIFSILPRCFPQTDSLSGDSTWKSILYKQNLSTVQKGNLLHPFELIQGIIPGMHITRPGSNPFEPYTIRSQGLHTFSSGNLTPVLLIDGMPVQDLSWYSPLDVGSVAGSANPGTTPGHSLRSLQGYLSIRTVPLSQDSFFLQYTPIFSIEGISRQTPIADAARFLRLDGKDEGRRNNFQEEISRNGLTHRHHLTISRRWKSTLISATGQLQQINPVLRNTSSRRSQARVSFQQTIWKDRITLKLIANRYSENNEYGETAAFFYANRFNPTSPILDPQLEEFGGYYEKMLFDYYNPVSIVNQISFNGKISGSLYQTITTIELLPQLNLYAMYGRESRRAQKVRQVPKTSLYDGDRVDHFENDTENDWFEVSLTQNLKSKSWHWINSIGYNFQQLDQYELEQSGLNFSLPILPGTRPDEAKQFSEHEEGSLHRMIEAFTKSKLTYRNQWSLSTYISLAGSSRTGPDKSWGLFYGLASRINILSLWEKEVPNRFDLSLDYGKSGAPPGLDNLDRIIIDPASDFYYNGDYIHGAQYRHYPNPDLGWEVRNQFTTTLTKGFFNDRLVVSYQRFWGRTSDIIDKMPIPNTLYQFEFQWKNLHTVLNRGWSTQLKSIIVNSKQLRWDLNLNAFRFRAFLDDFNSESRYIGRPCGCGNRPYVPRKIQKDREFGLIYAWQSIFSVQEARYIELDRNGDGRINDNDQVVTGNSLAKWIINMRHDLSWNRLSASLRFRGSFGHILIHENRLAYENKAQTNTHNIVTTKYFDRRRDGYLGFFSEEFAESGNFLMLDRFFLSYDFSSHQQGKIGWKLLLGARNLFIVTNYSGIDPEVRYEEIRYRADGSSAFTREDYILAGGIESERTYPLTRSFYLGLQIII